MHMGLPRKILGMSGFWAFAALTFKASTRKRCRLFVRRSTTVTWHIFRGTKCGLRSVLKAKESKKVVSAAR